MPLRLETLESRWLLSGDPVAAYDDFYEMSHDRTLAATSVLTNDTGTGISVTGHTGVSHGSVTVQSNGSFTYVPATGYVGTDSFTYNISNGTDTATANVNLDITNAAPDAEDDYYTVYGPAIFTGSASVLANDTDDDADTLTVSLVSDVSDGELHLRPSGTFAYSPNAGFTGSDAFSYSISDGLTSDTATVYLTVAGNASFTWTLNPPTPPSITPLDPQDNDEGDAVYLAVTASDTSTLKYAAVNLPLGLDINSSTGVISGTVDDHAVYYSDDTFPITIIVVNAHGGSATTTFPWAIHDTPVPPELTSPGNQSDQAGDSITLNLTATQEDDDPLYFDAEGLPYGLWIDSETGVISGTISPWAASNTAYTVIVTVTDYWPEEPTSDSVTFTWTVTPPAPNPDLTNPGAQVSAAGDEVYLYLEATDPGYELTFTASGLPDGLSIDPRTGVIYGTLTNSAASGSPHSVTVLASDGLASDSAAFTWTVGDVRLLDPADQFSLASGSASLALDATSASTVALTYGASGLPSGLTINSATGVISGTLSSGTGTATVTVTAHDGSDTATQSFLWQVDRLTLDNPGPQSNREGTSVSVTLNAIDYVGAPTFSATGLPTGLSINSSTGVITGTLHESAHLFGPYHVTVTATDSVAVSQSFVWSVQPQIAVFHPGPQGNAGGDTISLTIAAEGPGTLSWGADNLPDGLSLNASTGEITGTIDTAAVAESPYQVIVSVYDGTYLSIRTFTWEVATIYVTVDDQAHLTNDTVSLSLAAAYHGSGTLGYSATGLPTGLSLNSATGNVTGTLTNGSDTVYTPTLTVTDGTDTTTLTFNWAVSPRVTVGGVGDQINVTGESISLTVVAEEWSSDTVTFTYGASGLPSGLSINSGTGVISGTLSASPSATADTITVTASDGSGSASQTFTWSIVPLRLDNPGDQASLGSATINLALQATVASGYTATYSAAGLPPGLSINSSTGVISGTLDGGALGNSYIVEVSAATGGVSSSHEFIWRVGTVVVTRPDDQTDTESDTISLGVGAGTVSGTLTYSAAGLPTGLSINSSTGAITGTIGAGAAGQHLVTVVASNGSMSDSRVFSWTVDPIIVVEEIDAQSDLEGDSVSITVTATGPGTLSYSADGLPDGLTINSSTGVISGTVASDTDGSYVAEVTVSNGSYETAVFFIWTIQHGSNSAPVLTSPGTQVNVTGDEVQLVLSASDADDDTLLYYAYDLPDGLYLDSETGILSGLLPTWTRQAEPYAVTVTVDDSNGGSDTQTFSWLVNGTTLSVAAVELIEATEGAATGDVTVATFTSTDPNWDASAFTVTINWGDDTSDLGYVEGANGSYTVIGGHVYTQPGSYTPEIIVSDGEQEVSDTSSATVSAAALVVHGGFMSGALLDTEVSGTWAWFQDANPYHDADDYTAIINWGDGSDTTVGTVTGSRGRFVVTGSHTYEELGDASVTVTVYDMDESSASATSVAQVGELQAGVSATLTLANFTTSDTTTTAGAFTATVNWGDTTTTTAATVSGSNGVFTVEGTHAYLIDSWDMPGGTYPVEVTINGPDSTVLKATKGVFVTRPPVTTFLHPLRNTPGESSVSGKLVTFVVPNGTDPTSEFTATIIWGDSTATTTGTIEGGNGLFHVVGGHTYATSGGFPIEVTLSQAWSEVIPTTVVSLEGVFGAFLDARIATDDTKVGNLLLDPNTSMTLAGEEKGLTLSKDAGGGALDAGNSWSVGTPLVYKIGSTLEVSATFKKTGDLKLPVRIIGRIKRVVTGGRNPTYVTLGWTEEKVIFQAGPTYSINAKMDRPFSKMAILDLEIDWYMKVGEVYHPIGSTTKDKYLAKRVYVTYNKPTQGPNSSTALPYDLRETFIALGSQQNTFAATPEQALQNTWATFQELTVKRATPPAGVDKQELLPLVYWKGSNLQEVLRYKSEQSPATQLVSTMTGGCYAWADLFVAALYAQGIMTYDANKKVATVTGTNEKLEILDLQAKNNLLRLVVKNGIKGQNNEKPPTEFVNHVVVRIGNRLYDPSYGKMYEVQVDPKAPIPDAAIRDLLLLKFQEAALAGLKAPGADMITELKPGVLDLNKTVKWPR